VLSQPRDPRATTFRRYRVLLAVPADRSTGALLRGLRSHSFDATIIHDGTRVLDTVRAAPFTAVVLEVGLPGLDTSAVLTGLARLAPDTPVIALTTRELRDAVVAGLRGGKDDYLLAPYPTDELITRLRLRVRDHQPAEHEVTRRGDITVDTELGLVSVDGQLITLTPTEFALLTILISHPDQALSREQLTAMLWKDPPSSNVIEVYIGYLRRKLGADRIRTVRGVGYLLEE
jgi:two-component system response regulator QseB